jgi:predicted deacylase
VIAGIHGDEYEGPAAIWQVAAALNPRQITGKVTLIPVASPSAFTAGTRMTPPDGRNLAREFPGDPTGSSTQRLAHWLFTHFGEQCDYLIDLHSGGVEYVFYPVVGFRGQPVIGNPSFAAARAFGLPVLWQLPDAPGVFSREVQELGTPSIGAEYLGGGRLSNEGAAAYAAGILSCFRHWGIYSGPVEPMGEPEGVYSSRWLLCPAEGVFVTTRRLGDAFRAGETLATIHSPTGTEIAAVIADAPGRILALRSKAYARQGDWAVMLGTRVRV